MSPQRPCGPRTRAGGFTDGSSGASHTHFLEVLPTPSVSQLPGFRIFIQKQGLKKLYRESAAENSALPRGTPPAAWQCPLFGWPSAKPSQSIPVKRVIRGSSRSLRGGGERSMAPSPPSPPP